MTGGDLARAHRIRHLDEAVELDVVVAQGTRDGCAAGQVLVDERLHYLLFELPLEIHDIVRNADLLGHAARVVHIVERAAASGTAALGNQLGQSALVPELHGEADHRVALAHQKSRHRGAVDAAAHGDRDRSWLKHVRKSVAGARRKPPAPPPGSPPAEPCSSGRAKSACWPARGRSPGRWPSIRATASMAPLEQAAPVETEKPRRSSAITKASPSMPSK
jgi:hypothetical protein